MANENSREIKLDKLKEYYDSSEDSKILSDTEKRLRNLIVQSDLINHDAVIAIVNETKEKINGINIVLQFNEALTDLERKLLFRQRKVYQFFLDRLDPSAIDKKLQALDEFLDRKVEEMGE